MILLWKVETTKLQLLPIIASQHFHNNLSGLTGLIGIRASPNVDLDQLEHVPEIAPMETNSVLAKKMKPKLVQESQHVMLTNMIASQMNKDWAHQTPDNYR